MKRKEAILEKIEKTKSKFQKKTNNKKRKRKTACVTQGSGRVEHSAACIGSGIA